MQCYPGGSAAIKKAGWPLPGQVKHEWAERIGRIVGAGPQCFTELRQAARWTAPLGCGGCLSVASIRVQHRRLVLALAAGHTLPRGGAAGAVGRSGLPRVAAVEGRRAARSIGGTGSAFQRAAHGGAASARHGGGQVAGRAGRQPAAGADPVQRGPAAAPALRAEPRRGPGPHPLPAGGRGGLGQDHRGGLGAARTEVARPRQTHSGGRAQGAGAPVAGGNAPALRRDQLHFVDPSAAGCLAPVARRQRGGQPVADARPGDLRAGFGEAAGIAAWLEPGADPDLQPRTLRGLGVGGVGLGHHRRSAPHGRQHRAGGALQAGRGAGGSLALSACCSQPRRIRARPTSSCA
jgi:hypothetical protein